MAIWRADNCSRFEYISQSNQWNHFDLLGTKTIRIEKLEAANICGWSSIVDCYFEVKDDIVVIGFKSPEENQTSKAEHDVIVWRKFKWLQQVKRKIFIDFFLI